MFNQLLSFLIRHNYKIKIMLSDTDRKMRRFQQALRVYHNCQPFCSKDATSKKSIEANHSCYQQCAKRHMDLEQKLSISLKFNIQ